MGTSVDVDPAGGASSGGLRSLRIVTWNVHSCIGQDGRGSLSRVVDVLASLSPDVVALQEVEVGRVRTGRVDQPRVIADRLGMRLFFTSALHWHDGKYGIATLSRLPLALVQAGRLPRLSLPVMQPRVAMAVSVATSWGALVVVNTHLGLVARERRRQVEELLGPRWLGGALGSPLAVLCGDLNAVPTSLECTRLRSRLAEGVREGRRQATFPSRWPLLRLDHVLHGGGLECTSSTVVRSPHARRASDHLPVVCDLVRRDGAGSDPGW